MKKDDFILGYIQIHGTSTDDLLEEQRVQFLSRVYDKVSAACKVHARDLEWIQKTDLADTRLSSRVYGILFNHGILTAARLVDTSKAELEAMLGLGRKGLREIKDLLEAHGVELK